MSSEITVVNEGRYHAFVAINRWCDSGSIEVYSILPGKSGTWGRSDPRGFIMSMALANAAELPEGNYEPYYVLPNSIIELGSLQDSVRYATGVKIPQIPTNSVKGSPAERSPINITNKGTANVWVQINRWDVEGQTGEFCIRPADVATWKRTPFKYYNLGFVMGVQFGDVQGRVYPYYIRPDSNIEVGVGHESVQYEGGEKIPIVGPFCPNGPLGPDH